RSEGRRGAGFVSGRKSRCVSPPHDSGYGGTAPRQLGRRRARAGTAPQQPPPARDPAWAAGPDAAVMLSKIARRFQREGASAQKSAPLIRAERNGARSE